nr:hypothetical protein [uncultured Bacteroides sp.]
MEKDIEKIKNKFVELIRTELNKATPSDSNKYKAAIFDIDYAAMDLLEAAVQSCNIKDEFEYSYSPTHIFSIDTQSTKTKSSYNFGFDMCSMKFYFNTYIENPLYVKNLQDDFILDFFRICNEYHIDYISDQHFGTSGKSIYNKSIKSNIFRLFRDYTTDLLSEDGFEVYDNALLGHFQKEWEYDYEQIDIDKLYNELCISMKYFYKFNYHLWKAKDNEEKRRK